MTQLSLIKECSYDWYLESFKILPISSISRPCNLVAGLELILNPFDLVIYLICHGKYIGQYFTNHSHHIRIMHQWALYLVYLECAWVSLRFYD